MSPTEQPGQKEDPCGDGLHALPIDADLAFKKGCRLLAAKMPADAVKELARAATLAPDTPSIMERLAEAYVQDNRYLEGLRLYDRLIAMDLANASTWLATANALVDIGETAQAAGAYERALETQPGNAEVEHNLARAFYRLGDLENAVTHMETAIARADTVNSWVSLATIIPGSPSAEHKRILEVRRGCAERLSREASDVPDHPPMPRSSGRRHRVAYLSAYFNSANYMKPVWGVINHHDREGMDLHLFSDSPVSDMSGYMPDKRDQVHEVGALDNGTLAELIQSFEIDVLVDLNAYSTPERLALFLRPPAPLTLAWFNMYATSGLARISHRVS